MLFADDLLIFCRGDVGSVNAVKDMMSSFSAMSGLEVNQGKSSVFVAGVPPHVKDQLLHILGFQEGSFPVRYLGVPLSPRRLLISDYEGLIQRLTGRVQSWSVKLRSYARRLQLVKSVLLSIQRFWSFAFPFPAGVAKRIKSICRRYLWSGSIGSGKALVAWRMVCQPFLNGGLQIKEVLGGISS